MQEAFFKSVQEGNLVELEKTLSLNSGVEIDKINVRPLSFSWNFYFGSILIDLLNNTFFGYWLRKSKWWVIWLRQKDVYCVTFPTWVGSLGSSAKQCWSIHSINIIPSMYNKSFITFVLFFVRNFAPPKSPEQGVTLNLPRSTRHA